MVAEFPDWFSAYAKPNFRKYLFPLAGQHNLTFLQLGAYTGDASVWLVENILTNPEQVLFDVDTWNGSDEEVHKSINFNDVYKTYKDKTKDYTQIIPIRSPTFDYLLNYNYFKYYEFIYVDADHTAASVLLDAELSWRLLRQGGLLAFDDYQWGQHLPASKSPKLGIDLFLERHAGEYELLESGFQVWIRKL
jgi:hypothetical protein